MRKVFQLEPIKPQNNRNSYFHLWQKQNIIFFTDSKKFCTKFHTEKFNREVKTIQYFTIKTRKIEVCRKSLFNSFDLQTHSWLLKNILHCISVWTTQCWGVRTRMSDVEVGRAGGKDHDSTPKTATRAKCGLDWSQEPGTPSRSPLWVVGTKYVISTSCL